MDWIGFVKHGFVKGRFVKHGFVKHGLITEKKSITRETNVAPCIIFHSSFHSEVIFISLLCRRNLLVLPYVSFCTSRHKTGCVLRAVSLLHEWRSRNSRVEQASKSVPVDFLEKESLILYQKCMIILV